MSSKFDFCRLVAAQVGSHGCLPSVFHIAKVGPPLFLEAGKGPFLRCVDFASTGPRVTCRLSHEKEGDLCVCLFFGQFDPRTSTEILLCAETQCSCALFFTILQSSSFCAPHSSKMHWCVVKFCSAVCERKDTTPNQQQQMVCSQGHICLDEFNRRGDCRITWNCTKKQ
jgi:hypothetical protein